MSLVLACCVAPMLFAQGSPHLADGEELFAHARHSCGSELEPEAVARMAERLAAGGEWSRTGSTSSELFVVPVTVHVVRRSNGSGGLGGAAVRGSLLKASADFAPAGIEFCQVGETVFVDDDSFYDCVCGGEISALRAARRVEDTVNIYFAPNLVLNGVPLCGLATYPGTGNSAAIVRNSCAGSTSTTLTHELGHFFDLLHTHDRTFGRECADGSNCATAGDLICDTPADPGLSNRVNQNCAYTGPSGPNCNGGSGSLDPATDNFMSYGRRSCLDRFTQGQIQRMRTALFEERPELARSACPTEVFAPTPGLGLVSSTVFGASARTASSQPAVAPGGRFVAFVSASEDLLPDGVSGNGVGQVFVRDLLTGELEHISHGLDGAAANGFCDSPALSADGRYVAYSCSARNVVPGITNTGTNVLRHDRLTGKTLLVTPGIDGGGANVFTPLPLAMSFDGQVIAFESPATNLLDAGTFPFDRIYVADLRAGTLELASASSLGEGANNRAYEPALSGDGRVVAFASYATNLHPDTSDGASDVFVHYRGSGKTVLASIGALGERYPGQARKPSLSADGARVAFVWAALGNLPDDRTGIARGDVVVKVLDTGRFLLASASADGQQSASGGASPALSADGRFVAFRSAGNEFYDSPTALVDMDVWLKDLWHGSVHLASPGGGGADSLGAATDVAMDAGARVIAFSSLAINLVVSDDNGVEDVFAFGWKRVVPPASSVRGGGGLGRAPAPGGSVLR